MTRSPVRPLLLAMLAACAAAPAEEPVVPGRSAAAEVDDPQATLRLRSADVEALAASRPPADPELRKARLALGRAQVELGGFEPAAAEARAVLENAGELPPDHPDVLAAQELLGVTGRELGDLPGARSRFEEVLAARVAALPADHADVLRVREHLATTLYRLGLYREAREILEEVLAIRRKSPAADELELAGTMQLLAGVRFSLGDLAGAAALDEEVHAVRARRLRADHPLVLRATANLAGASAELGDHERANELYERVVRTWSRILPADHADLLTARMNLAGVRHELGDAEGARDLLEEIVRRRAAKFAPDHPDLLLARQNLAVALDSLGDAPGARELLDQVLEVWTGTLAPDHPDLLKAMSQAATVRVRAGDVAGAMELQERLVAIRESVLPPDHSDLLHARQHLAYLFAELGQLERAREIEEEVLAAREATLPETHRELLQSKANLAATRSNLGDHRGAVELQEEVLRQRERILPEGHPERVSAELNLAEYRVRLGEHEAARDQVASALAEMRASARTLWASAPRAAREEIRSEVERLALALDLAARCDPEGKLAGLEVGVLESLRDVSIAGPAIALAVWGREDLQELRKEIASTRERLVELAADGPAEGRSIEAWRSELFEVASRRDRSERELLGRLYADGAPGESIEASAIASALAPDALAVSLLRCPRRPAVDADGGVPRPRPDVLLAFVVRPDGGAERVELGVAQEIEEVVVAWRAALGKPLADRGVAAAGGSPASAGAPGSLESLGGELRARLLDPILRRAPGAKVLHLVSDDPAALVPLDALPLEGGFVGDRIAVHTEVSLARLVRPMRLSTVADALLVVGAIDYDAEPGEGALPSPAVAATPPAPGATSLRAGPGGGSFPSLPATADEAREVAELFAARARDPRIRLGEKVEELLGSAADRDAVRRAAAGARYVHLATHGWFAPERFRSQLDLETDEVRRRSLGRAEETLRGFAPEVLCGLALAGANRGRDATGRVPGIVTAEELATWDMSGCELAVLSACETNVGIRRAGQGIQSLQAALHAAGARTAVTSLWKVDDEATRRLMRAFYENLWKRGMRKSAALWAAKRAMHAEGRPARDWAAWMLTGEPD